MISNIFVIISTEKGAHLCPLGGSTTRTLPGPLVLHSSLLNLSNGGSGERLGDAPTALTGSADSHPYPAEMLVVCS